MISMSKQNDPEKPTPISNESDAKELQQALKRTGQMLKSAGLPFEPDEFTDDEKNDLDQDK